MKKIFRNIHSYELNGLGHSNGEGMWHYGELPEETKINYTFDDAIRCSAFYGKYTPFKKRLYAICLSTSFEINSTKRKNFKSASHTITPEPISLEFVVFKELQEKLTVPEFLDWCKDNNVNMNIIE